VPRARGTGSGEGQAAESVCEEEGRGAADATDRGRRLPILRIASSLGSGHRGFPQAQIGRRPFFKSFIVVLLDGPMRRRAKTVPIR